MYSMRPRSSGSQLVARRATRHRHHRQRLSALLLLMIVLSLLPVRLAVAAPAGNAILARAAAHPGPAPARLPRAAQRAHRSGPRSVPAGVAAAATRRRPALALPPLPSLGLPTHLPLHPVLPGARAALPRLLAHTGATPSGTITIQRGWNLVSLPVTPSTPLRASTFLLALGSVVPLHLAALYALVGSGWSAPVLDAGGQLNAVDFPLRVGSGYLLYSDTAGSLTLAGSTSTSPTWSLATGWNLVGLPLGAAGAISATTVLTTLLGATQGRLAALYALAATGWSTPVLDIGGHLSATEFSLQAAMGYLLYSDSATQSFAVPGYPPPDPRTVAPPVNPTVPTSVFSATTFLYTGPNAEQTGVVSGTIELTRTAVLRGEVTDAQGKPLPGATIAVASHPDYGQTLSRSDGMFDLVVNGGSTLTLTYSKDDYLPAQREVPVPVQDSSLLPTVALLQPDPAVSAINLASSAPVQVARGSVVTDSAGTRRQTLLFFPGTTATMTLPDGATQAITPTLHVRLTEYTAGANGTTQMPAALPASSGYTYATKMSVDEAVVAHATGVQFSKPVISYLENFLRFKVGIDVPFGAYNQQSEQWVPQQDGRVVQILRIANGQAVLDVDGAGQQASGAELQQLGITTPELAELAALYQPGQSLWRVPIDTVASASAAAAVASHPTNALHASALARIQPRGPQNDGYLVPDDGGSWDFNMGITVPPDAAPPSVPPPYHQPSLPDPTDPPGFEIENQAVSENLLVAGTPFSLHYQGDRMPGRTTSRTLVIPLSGASVSPSLLRIVLEVDVAGEHVQQTFPAVPNQSYTDTWDGKDVYGQTLWGPQPITVRIGYVYPAVYLAPSQNPLDTDPNYDAQFGHFTYYGTPATVGCDLGAAAWAAHPRAAHAACTGRSEIALWQTWQSTIGTFVVAVQGEGLGGWTLSVHHTYDPYSHTLYQGDGIQRGGVGVNPSISTLAGKDYTGAPCSCGDGGPATQATFWEPYDVAAGPDGSIYIADSGAGLVRRVAANGIIRTFAGGGRAVACFYPTDPCGDGGPATQAMLLKPTGIALGPDGSLYIADSYFDRVRRVAPDGIISTVAGSGQACPSLTASCGDGGPATQAALNVPSYVVVSADGSLYIADSGDHRVRRVAPDGSISTVAGTGAICERFPSDGPPYCGDGGPAEQATLNRPEGLALGPDGSLYIADGGYQDFGGADLVRRVTPDGLISTVAGGGSGCSAQTDSQGDGCLATQVDLGSPQGLAVGPDGSLYFTEWGNARVRAVSPQGIIRTVAGSTLGCFTTVCSGYGEDGPATQATLLDPTGVALGSDGNLYIADAQWRKVLRVGSPLPGLALTDYLIPSADGSQVYVFDASGRHLETLDALTNVVLYRFGYDSAGRLISITDRDGNVTTVQRDGAGNPVAIVAPHGQRTTFTLDANGYLARVADPTGAATTMTYTGGGLLTGLSDPLGHGYHFGYDAEGRLVQDQRPDGGVFSLARVDAVLSDTTAYTVTETSPLSRTSTYAVQDDAAGDRQRIATDAAGLTTSSTLHTDQTYRQTTPVGVVVSGAQGPGPRFGLQAPLLTLRKVTTPGGLSSVQALTETVGLADPANVFSMTALTDTVTLNGQTGTRAYSAATRTTVTTSPVGRTTSAMLDSDGRLARTSVPGLAPVQYSYDSRGRVQTISQGTRVYTFSYDPASGYLTSVTDPLGRVTTFTRDADGRITSEALPGNRTVGFGYDADGNLVTLTPPGKTAHTFGYTALNQIQRYTPPGGASLSTAYNLDGQPSKTTLPDGSTITPGYDGAGRLVSLATAGPSDAGMIDVGYDANSGNLSSVTGPDGGTVTLSYDGGLVTGISATGVMSGTVGYTYVPNFRVVSDSVNGGNGVSYQYDADGLLTNAGSLALTYDPHNGLPTGSSQDAISTSMSHDQVGDVTSSTAQDEATTLLAEQYTRDGLGRVVTQTETIGGTTHTFAYSYDAAGHLSGVTEDGHSIERYGYDANDNRTSVTTPSGGMVSARYDAQDRLIQQGSISYVYNANGYLQSTTDSSTHQTTSYTYDALGNLTAVKRPDGTRITYLMDGLGRRIEEQVNGTPAWGFLYGTDALRPIAELDGSGNLVSRFVYTAATGAPASMVKGGATYRLLTDDTGSVRLVVNAATGAVAQQLTYDAFGNVLTDSNPGFQPFGFAGSLYDPQTGLVRFGARDYDPQAGRWTAKDPLLFAGGQANLYAYVGDDPLNRQDPTGLGGTVAAAGIGGVGGVGGIGGAESLGPNATTVNPVSTGVESQMGTDGFIASEELAEEGTVSTADELFLLWSEYVGEEGAAALLLLL